MNGDIVSVSVQILEKDYMVSCPSEEQEALVESAAYLDRKMKEVRDGGKVLGTERTAVMTALNIVNEMLQLKREQEDQSQTLVQDVRRLEDKIVAFLGRRE